MKMKKVKWGIIGCGDVTEIKSGPAFNRVRDSELVAVMRRDTAKAKDYAERHLVPKWYDNAENLINDSDVNAIYIATPPSSHCAYTHLAAKAGKPVYVEKPMAANYYECLSMIDICEKHKVPLFVAYYRRVLPLFLKVKELVEKGSIGKILQTNIKLHLVPNSADYNKENLPWRLKPEIAGAGYFYDLASHQFDYLDFLCGSIEEVSGNASNLGGLYKVEDNVTASWKFSSGILGTGSWNFVSTKKNVCDEIEIIGDKGKIIFPTFIRDPIKLITVKGNVEIISEWPKHIQEPLIKLVVEELLGKGTCPSSGLSGARTNWVLDKILNKI
ncbi:MAG: Gfo/Idh/MocA family oxidoreductase [Melioribacteraceae bacterium]|nr:Gfo/Idh/MocA family oxidoreductase [Melioribacteraceae bacterium]